MQTHEKLRLRIAFDVINTKGKSLANGRYNAVEMPLGVNKLSDTDITKLHLWLRSVICELQNTELTAHLLPAQPASGVNADNNCGTQPQPLAEYQDLHTRISVPQAQDGYPVLGHGLL